MKLVLARRAVTDIQRIDAWWRTNRPAAPNAFLDDLDAAKVTILGAPQFAPVYARVARGTVRRVLLPTSQHHVYYRVESADRVRVVAVWGASRRRGPRLG